MEQTLPHEDAGGDGDGCVLDDEPGAPDYDDEDDGNDWVSHKECVD